MKKAIVSSAVAAVLLGAFAPHSMYAANPYLPLWEHLPDGEPRVFEDPDNPGKYRIYIIGSHDVKFTEYCGVDIRIWSAPVENLNDWRDEGPVFTFKDPSNERWDIMFAPDLVEVRRRDENGERTIREYYLYPHSRGPGREPMVAKSDRPTGPFEIINLSSDGRSLLPGSVMGFDPSVYIEYIDDPNDPDYDIGFRAYGYWGFQKSHAAQLDQNTMYSVRPDTQIIQNFIPASNSYGDIRDPEGTQYPHVFPGEDLSGFNFFEAASIRKVGNKYVWVYSGYSGPDYGIGSSNATLRYAYGDSPLGPWKIGGVLIDARAPVMSEDGNSIVTSYSGHNTHGSIEQIGDRWYVFYHRAPRGFGFARQPMVAPVDISWDEASVANGGKVVIKGWNPYDMPATVHAGGHTYNGAEVTSEGFNIYGLDPFSYYSAGIACYLSNHSNQADSWDIWQDHAPLTNVGHGDIVGYKYFGFGGLANDADGISAFEGTGENMMFHLFVQPISQREFKINVWLDAPWDNDTWNGTKIGEIVIPSSSGFEISQFSIDVSSHVQNLTGKHAIYLIPEGNSSGLCNLIGLGFSADGKDIVRPVPPEISIALDGVPVKLPDTPVRADESNGITDYSLYHIDYDLPEGAAKISEINASSDNDDVIISMSAIQTDGIEATLISFDYHGAVKNYKINVPLPPLPDKGTPPPDTQEQVNDTTTAADNTVTGQPDVSESNFPWRVASVIGGLIVIGASVFATLRKKSK